MLLDFSAERGSMSVWLGLSLLLGRVLLPQGAHLVKRALHDAQHCRMSLLTTAALDRACHIHMQLEGFLVRMSRHEPILRAPGEHRFDQRVELGEHLVTG